MKSFNHVQGQSSTSTSSTSTVPTDHASVDTETCSRQQLQDEGPAAEAAVTNQKVTKVTVCFGTVRVVVPCGEGELRVGELIDRAVYRYRKATNKLSSCWLVTVLNLKTSADNAILDPSDKLRDVVDDREQIIAVYSEYSRNTGSGPPVGGTLSGFNGGIPAGAAGDSGGKMDTGASSLFCRPEVRGLAAGNSTETLKSCHSGAFGTTADQVVGSCSASTSCHVSRMQQCSRTKAVPQCCCASHVRHVDRLQRSNNGDNSSVLVTFSNVVGSLGVHVVPAVDCTGRNYGLTIHTIEPGGTVDSDKRLQVKDTITNINGTSLLGVDFVSAQEIFKRYLPSGELRLQVIKYANPGMTMADLQNSGPSTQSDPTFHLALENHVPVPPRTTSLTSSRVVAGSTSHREIETPNGYRRDELEKMPEHEEINRLGRSPSAPPTTGHRVRFLPPTNTRVIGNKLTVNLVKGVEGLGFSITTRDNPAGGNCPVYIKNILPRGAAIDNGCLEAGDRLLQVNDVEVTGKSQSEVAAILRSLPLNENVRLIVSRHDVADSNGLATDSSERLMTGSEVEVEVEAVELMPHSSSGETIAAAAADVCSTVKAVNNSQHCAPPPAAGILKNKDNKATENGTEEDKDLTVTDGEGSATCTAETASVQVECESSMTFSREGFGRQSMSEKRKGHIDPRVSAVYRRIRQTKEGYATDRSGRLLKAESAESVLSRHSRSWLATASLLNRSPSSFGPTLGLTKSSSLESLQTAVNEFIDDDDCGQSPSLAQPTRGGASTGRGFNNSFRSAVDRSFNSKENCSQSDENSVNKQIETNQNETTLSHATTTCSSPRLEEVSTLSENRPDAAEASKKNKQRDKSRTRFKGLTAILRFGKSRKKSAERCNGVTTVTSPEIERKLSVDWQHPSEPEISSSTRNLPPPDVLSRALEKQRERGGMSHSSSSREPSGERSLCSTGSQSARQSDHPPMTSREPGMRYNSTTLQRRMHRQMEDDAGNSRDETDQRSSSGNFHMLGNFMHQNGREATSNGKAGGRQFPTLAHSSSVQPSPMNGGYYHGRFSSVPVNMLPEEDNNQHPSRFSSTISMCNGAPYYNCSGYPPSSLQEHFPWGVNSGNAYPNVCREIPPDGFIQRQEFSASSSGTADISTQFCYHQHDYRIPVPPYWYRPGFNTIEPTGKMYHRRVVSHTASDAYLRLPQTGPLQDCDFDRLAPGIPDYRSLQIRRPAIHGRKEHAAISSSALV